MKFRLLLLFIFFSTTLFAQYAVKDIPLPLKNGVSAVVRNKETTVKLHAYNKATISFKEAVTVFNPQGDDVITKAVPYNDGENFNILEAKVFNASGEEIKKFKKRHFLDVSASGNDLYSDDRVLYAEFTPAFYPYTFELYYEYTTSSTAFLPQWLPISFYNVSIQHSSYTLHNENNVPLTVKEYNLESFEIENEETATTKNYVIENLPRIKNEELAPHYTEFAPLVRIALQKFQLFGSSASIENWEQFGIWQNEQRVKGREEIPQATKTKIDQLVLGIEDPKEKTRAIYQYMQNKMRYVSVQVGIGGWQPTTALEVDRLSYGDCKGLTNYTKALLKSQGIDSYYTLVNAGPSIANMDTDFVSLQFNHAILAVPFEDELVFLECTSKYSPFNYMGDFTDDRNVLMMTPNGGVVSKTHGYSAQDNLKTLESSIVIAKDLKVSGNVTTTSKGVVYGQKPLLLTARNDEVEMYYKEMWGHLNNLSVSNITFNNNRKNVVFTENVTFETENYLSTAGDRLLFNPNLFSRYNSFPAKEDNRKLPLKIRRGRTYEDAIQIIIPAEYQTEAIFEPISIKSKFGHYEAAIETTNNTLTYHRKLILEPGTFPKEEFNNYVVFLQKVAKKDKSKIVLSKIK